MMFSSPNPEIGKELQEDLCVVAFICWFLMLGLRSRYIIIMNFKAGDEVEVLRRNDNHGSWFPGKLLKVNFSNYTVCYEQLLTPEGESMVEKVHEEDIRPRPPLVDREESWVRGDILEVFDLYCWSAGKIVKAFNNNYFVVRIFGSIQLKEFHLSRMRVEQAWNNNKWVMIGKVSGKEQHSNNYGHFNSRYTSYRANDAIFGEACYAERIERGHRGAISPALIAKKHSHIQPILFTDDAVKRTGNKRKEISVMSGCHQQNKKIQPGKIDATSFSHAMVGENLHTSTRHRIVKTVGNRKNQVMHSSAIALQIVEESNECSVASCSGNNFPENTGQHARKGSKKIAGGLLDDANSTCPTETGEECLNVPEEKISSYIHGLELHAYQSTIQAFYAYGHLTWEQESVLTNLRISLHISNEEHMLQLRNLLSA